MAGFGLQYSLGRKGSGEEGVEQNDGFVEIPNEHSLDVWVLGIRTLTAPPRLPAASTRTLSY